MSQDRRQFIKTAALAAIGSGVAMQGALAGESINSIFSINKHSHSGKMKLTFRPYDLKLKHETIKDYQKYH